MAGRPEGRTGGLVALGLLALLVGSSGASFATDEPPIELRGLARAGDRPLAGAKVELLPWPGEQGDAELWLSGKLAVEPLAHAVSDARGAFVVNPPEPGNFRLRISAPGRAPLELTLPGVVESVDLPVAKLASDAGLSLVVLDGTGKPLAGTWVRVRNASGSGWTPGQIPWVAAEQRGRTAADGTLLLSRLARETIEVAAFAPGHLPFERELRAAARLEVRLEGAPASPAVVSGPDRAPRPGALALIGRAKWPLAPADAQGRLLLPLATGRAVPLVVRTRAGERLVSTLAATGEPNGAPRRLALAPPQELQGRVLGGKERVAVAGAVVWGLDPADAVRTDRGGTYRFGELGQEVVVLNAAASGYRTARIASGQLLEATSAGPTLLLDPAATLLGRAVDRSGRPVAEVEVVAAPAPVRGAGSMRPNEPVHGRTGPDGGFRLAGVAVGSAIELSAKHPDFAPWRESVPPLSPGPSTPRRIELDFGRVAAGRVQDPEARPVPGATLRLVHADENRQRLPWESEQPAGLATSDADGRFVLPRVAPGRYDLEVGARGFAKLRVPGVRVERGEGPCELGTVTLAPGVTLEGRVVDPEGRAVEGAGIYVEPVDSWRIVDRFYGGEDEEPATRSAADGWFRLEDLEPGKALAVTAELSGYGSTVANRVPIPRVEPLTLVLAPRGAIAGRVVDSAGSPIAGAKLAVSVRREVGLMTTMVPVTSPGDLVRSTEDGRFRVEGVDAGQATIHAVASGHAASTGTVVDLAPGQTVENVEIVLADGARLTGRVLGGEGEPRPGARVLARQGRGVGGSGMTDAEGRFWLDGVALGRGTVDVTDPDLGRMSREIEIVAGENRTELRFSAAGEVAGRVLSPSGVPLAGAAVELRQVGGAQMGWRRSATGGDGAFRFSALADGLYELAASAEGHASARLPEPIRVAGAPLEGIELRLSDGGVVRGRVLGVEIAEMSEVSVRATAATPGLSRSAALDYKGNFRLDHLEPGAWVVSARHEADGRTGERSVDVPADGAETEIEIELPRGFRLSGRVTRGGRPLNDVVVSLRARERRRSSWASTDVEGGFAFSGLVAGPYDLYVRRASTTLHEREVILDGDRELTIDLAATALRGQVIDAGDRRPLADAQASLTSAATAATGAGMGRSSARSDGGGRFAFENLSPGSYRLRVDREGYEAVERPIELGEEPGETLILELAATEGVVLEVRSASGGVPGTVQVALRGADGRLVATGMTDPDDRGRVRLSTAPRGSWELLAQADESALARVPVTSPGGPYPVVLPPGGALDVEVPGLAADDAWVVLRVVDEQGRPFEALSGMQLRTEWRLARGRARLVGLAPGRWLLSAQLPDGSPVSGTATVVGGQLTRVTLE